MNFCLCVLYAFLNDWTDFIDIFCVCMSVSKDDWDSQLDLVGPTQGGAQKGILRFTVNIFVYRWLIFIIWEIINRNQYTIFYRLPLVIFWVDQVQGFIKLNFRTLPTWYAVSHCPRSYVVRSSNQVPMTP